MFPLSPTYLNRSLVCMQAVNVWRPSVHVGCGLTVYDQCLLCKPANVYRLGAAGFGLVHNGLHYWCGHRVCLYNVTHQYQYMCVWHLNNSSHHIYRFRTSRPGSVCSTCRSLSCSTRTWSSCLRSRTPPATGSASMWVSSYHGVTTAGLRAAAATEAVSFQSCSLHEEKWYRFRFKSALRQAKRSLD